MPLKWCFFSFMKKMGRCSWKKKRAKGMCPLNWLISSLLLLLHVLCRDTSGKNRENLVSLNEKRSSSFASLFHWIVVFVECIVYKESKAVEAVVRIQAKKVKGRRSVLLNKKQEHETCSQCWCIFFLVGPHFFMLSANESARRSGISRGKKHEVAQLHFISLKKKEERMRKKRRRLKNWHEREFLFSFDRWITIAVIFLQCFIEFWFLMGV